MINLSEVVERIQNEPNPVTSSEFYRDYLELTQKYAKLVQAGLAKKKEGLLLNRMEDFGGSTVVSYNIKWRNGGE